MCQLLGWLAILAPFWDKPSTNSLQGWWGSSPRCVHAQNCIRPKQGDSFLNGSPGNLTASIVQELAHFCDSGVLISRWFRAQFFLLYLSIFGYLSNKTTCKPIGLHLPPRNANSFQAIHSARLDRILPGFEDPFSLSMGELKQRPLWLLESFVSVLWRAH